LRAAQQRANELLDEVNEAAVSRLEESIRTGDNGGVRAAIHVLDRILGKPAQPAEVARAEGGPWRQERRGRDSNRLTTDNGFREQRPS
jgi:hypothetical protein